MSVALHDVAPARHQQRRVHDRLDTEGPPRLKLGPPGAAATAGAPVGAPLTSFTTRWGGGALSLRLNGYAPTFFLAHTDVSHTPGARFDVGGVGDG